MDKEMELQEQRPRWLYKDGSVNEELFCEEFLARHPMLYSGSRFYTVDGMVENEALIHELVLEAIRPHIHVKQTKKVEGLVKALKLFGHRELPKPKAMTYHTANGTVSMTAGFRPERGFCHNRLSVNWPAEGAECPQWRSFLSQLLYEEDVQTLMEYLGYCLLPNTRAQKMLMIVGRGGEGKSVIGQVLRSIFGEHMVVSSITKLETNRFARADLEGKLLMVDDDMDLSALRTTNYIKSIVTASGPMDVERKGIQSYQTQLYARFLCFGNGALSSLHDRSDGFFRRQIILTAKARDPRRVDDPLLADRLVREKEGILLWMHQSLLRLMENGFRFTTSERAEEALQEHRRSGTGDVREFMGSMGYIQYSSGGVVSSKALYTAYRSWCEENMLTPVSGQSFNVELGRSAEQYGIRRTNNIILPGCKRCRGYVGISLYDSNEVFEEAVPMTDEELAELDW